MQLNWGNYPAVTQQRSASFSWVDQKIPEDEPTVLAHGMGRSYGDSCLNSSGLLLDTQSLNHFIEFDTQNGLLTCEAGVTLAEILHLIIPHGWFLPVVPGTKFVSIAGAIANDIHGKNHYQNGTFGCHVESLVLLRSDNQKIICSSQENSQLFQATIGGLGLTGLILSATIKLQKISSTTMHVENKAFASIEEFFEISAAAEQQYTYTAAWLDCQKKQGKGIMFMANHSQTGDLILRHEAKHSMNFYLPNFVLNKTSIRVFNSLYFANNKSKGHYRQYFDQYFFPLDSIKYWNRIYGKRGFLQYQFVIPFENKLSVMTEIMGVISQSGQGSFLSVLKTFGDKKSPGLLSFPMPGVTLALDFANQGAKTLALLTQLDDIVIQADGRVYPAKDARMSATAFQHYYPNWQVFAEYIDPKFNSDLWRRVTEHA